MDRSQGRHPPRWCRLVLLLALTVLCCHWVPCCLAAPAGGNGAAAAVAVGIGQAGPAVAAENGMTGRESPCGAGLEGLSAEDRLNLRCLRAAYPQIRAVEHGPDGIWLRLDGERRVLYATAAELAARPYAAATLPDRADGLARRLDPARMDVSLRASMHLPYLPDPERPATPAGYAPGRWRSYAFLQALYGADAATVRKGLERTSFQGRTVRMHAAATRALAAVEARLRDVTRRRPELKVWLVSAGGFLWRPIAGERRLSPHSFGIAIDLSPQRAPYWRWSRQERHPLQQAYDSEIVRAFEAEGFIWGGKWHEYDLMHFEYRPEIIAKARLLQRLEAAGEVAGQEGLQGGGDTVRDREGP